MIGRGGSSVSMEYLKVSNFKELFDSSYNLSSLKFLSLMELTELRVIWNGSIQAVNFQNLTELNVGDSISLRYVFSPTIARNLPRLSVLRIFDCEELEQNIENDQTSSQHHLHPICFPSLAEVSIRDCENLKYLFPVTFAHGGILKLKTISLEKVSKLEQVFEGDEANVSKDEEKVIHLPQLTDLKLSELPNLMIFSPVSYHFVSPSLEDLKVGGCPNITTRFSVDSKQSVHAKTQASQSDDETIVEESAAAQGTTWPAGSDISWRAF
ncbi:hypothetical protein ES319_A04G054300v1 [Gossypium barbadense]|uniref:Disease resistance protein At4g27190-like leucine-rich repeats domain-containing protein n=1 Tax=Gossypium barbadense TaxID=3634 RepID=A0A5J5W4B9_GOSBA|nr:hypothetical protein ES319_A04G054300v1 [Gossypium barbadense]